VPLSKDSLVQEAHQCLPRSLLTLCACYVEQHLDQLQKTLKPQQDLEKLLPLDLNSKERKKIINSCLWSARSPIVFFYQGIPYTLEPWPLVSPQDLNNMLKDLKGKQLYLATNPNDDCLAGE